MDDDPCTIHDGFEFIAGKANQYQNLYLFKSAKQRIKKDARRDGQE